MTPNPWIQTPTSWDTSRNWGKNPVLAQNASAGDTTLSLSGLGLGILPAGAVFFVAGFMYVNICPATISAGSAQLQIDPPLAAAALAAVAVTDFNALCTDADLTQQDSVMPALAKKIVDPATTKDAYDGKRALAKRDIASWLSKREFDPAGVTYPWDFNRAATFLELAYIYSDMSRRNEGIANEKSALYRQLYEDEIESVKFQYVPPMVQEQQPQSVRTTAVLWRA